MRKKIVICARLQFEEAVLGTFEAANPVGERSGETVGGDTVKVVRNQRAVLSVNNHCLPSHAVDPITVSVDFLLHSTPHQESRHLNFHRLQVISQIIRKVTEILQYEMSGQTHVLNVSPRGS